MAFTSVITDRILIPGGMRVHMGTYVSDSSSEGGNIDTGLLICKHIALQPKDTAVVASAPVVNGTLPLAGSAITIVTTADECGYWEAKGY